MGRIIDSYFPFGVGSGISTCGDLKCGLCGNMFNEGADAEEDYDRESVPYIDFAGITIGPCCFEDLEQEILSIMPTLLTWYATILNMREKKLNHDKALLEGVIGKPKEKTGCKG